MGFVYITIFSLKILCQKDFMIVLSWHLLLLASFFNFFQLFIVVFEKRSATHYKRWLLVFSFTAIDDEI
ncbi:hypothetical protein FIM54_01020 [Helicobacter pylori]|nr:hypothetical protein FIM54_01020 [Helicobacter pylori]